MEEENIVDGEEEKQLSPRQEQNQRNVANNEENLRAFADFTKDKGWGWVSAVGKAIDTADKISGGRSTHKLGKDLNRANKIAPGGRKAQRMLNRQAEKGVTKRYNQYKNIKSGNFNNINNSSDIDTKAEGTIKTEKKPKINIIVYIVIFVIFIFLLLFVILFSDTDSSIGQFAYGVTCPTVTVVDTGCNANAQNCSHIYDGEVEFEEYVAGVVAAEVGGAKSLEFYKVAAISARTFFLSHTDSSCTIKGNATRQAYMDVDASSNAELIKQAVEETKSMVLVKNNDLAPTYYASACVVNADANYYYVRYGTLSIGGAHFQKIPKEWDSNSSNVYRGYLKSWYSKVDQGNTNYEKKSCPLNHDYGMSQLGALYLAVSENYNYEQIIKYYYGNETEIMVNELQHNGTNGFINPTRIIKCVSAFGMRMHPIYHEMRMHNGVDLSGMNTGEPIYAVQSGTVTHVTKNLNIGSSGYGNYVVIQHDNGVSTLYAHMAYGTVPDSIYVGAEVSQGEQIGGVGTTGASTGNHLHYEVRVNGNRVNPADYIDWTNGHDWASCRK